MSKNTKLTNEELFALFQNEEDLTKKEELKNAFFLKNRAYPIYIANKFANTKMEYDELISIAYLGMVKAFNHFNPERKILFTTFSSRIMTNEILMQLRKRSHKQSQYTVNLSQPIMADDTDGLCYGDIAKDESCNVEEEVLNKRLAREIMDIATDILTDVEYEILMNRTKEIPLKQRELSEKLGVSQSYVSRLEVRAINRIRVQLERQGTLFK